MSADAIVHSYYDLLAVSPSASEEEIRDAENALRKVFEARAVRNDPVATAMLRRLLEAHEVLLDPQRRTEYDRDPLVLARSFVDVAHPLPLGRYKKLEQVAAWLDEAQDA